MDSRILINILICGLYIDLTLIVDNQYYNPNVTDDYKLLLKYFKSIKKYKTNYDFKDRLLINNVINFAAHKKVG